MANNPVVNSITFIGSIAEQASIGAQGIAGGLTFLLPNVPPIVGQLLTATAVNNANVFLGWASASASIQTSQLSSVEGTGSKVQLTNGSAAPSAVVAQLGVAANYAILASAGITNSGSSVIAGGNIGSNPTTTITGFPPGAFVAPAAIDNANAAAANTAAASAVTFFSGLTFTSLSASSVDLSTAGVGGSNRYIPGNYSAGTSMAMSTGIVLDAQGNPAAQFIFKAGSTVNLASNQSVSLINGADAANVVWLVGSALTTVAPSTMVGNILATSAVTLGGGTLNGRAFASAGPVTISTATNVTASAGAGVIAAGDVVIYDAAGNIKSSGVLLSSLGGAAGVLSFNGRSGAVSPALNDYNFNQLAGTLAISQINSKQGNGNAVQLTNSGATVAGDVVTYDANSNVVDSGTLLSSLASNASVALKANSASPTFTGVPAAPTAAPLTNSTQIATTAYADAAVAVETGRATAAEALLAPKASPTFTGTVTTAAISATSIQASSFVAVTGNLDLSSGHGHIVQNSDIAGSLTITNPATSASFNFVGTYAGAPVAFVTPTSDPSVAGIVSYWVTTTTAAITVHVNTTPGTSITFNYLTLGN
jgi:hypothetical protein